jgi:hypothetical protein
VTSPVRPASRTDLPASFLLLPAGGPASSQNFARSVAAPIDPARLPEWLAVEDASVMRSRITNRLGAWGSRDNTKRLAGSGIETIFWDRVEPGTLALFSNHDEYFTRARVIGKELSESASVELWGSPEFRWLVLLTEIEPVSIPLDVVRQGAGFSGSYNINRQNLVPQARRETSLWAALVPFIEQEGDDEVSVVGPPS